MNRWIQSVNMHLYFWRIFLIIQDEWYREWRELSQIAKTKTENRVNLQNSTIFFGQTGVQILANTTAAGHPKTYHDQIWGTRQSHMYECRCNGSFKIKSGWSKPAQAVAFLRQTFKRLQSGKLKRHFFKIPPRMIYTKESSVNTLDIDGTGIKT